MERQSNSLAAMVGRGGRIKTDPLWVGRDLPYRAGGGLGEGLLTASLTSGYSTHTHKETHTKRHRQINTGTDAYTHYQMGKITQHTHTCCSLSSVSASMRV